MASYSTLMLSPYLSMCNRRLFLIIIIWVFWDWFQ